MPHFLKRFEESLEIVSPEMCYKIGAGEKLNAEEIRALLNLIVLARRVVGAIHNL